MIMMSFEAITARVGLLQHINGFLFVLYIRLAIPQFVLYA